ncbi:MAG: hypothetical protein KDD40_04975, partial [Bdellovibrionales bacterium]|nr:hypothetical protein [Bdellovibrionales bacterium]
MKSFALYALVFLFSVQLWAGPIGQAIKRIVKSSAAHPFQYSRMTKKGVEAWEEAEVFAKGVTARVDTNHGFAAMREFQFPENNQVAIVHAESLSGAVSVVRMKLAPSDFPAKKMDLKVIPSDTYVVNRMFETGKGLKAVEQTYTWHQIDKNIFRIQTDLKKVSTDGSSIAVKRNQSSSSGKIERLVVSIKNSAGKENTFEVELLPQFGLKPGELLDFNINDSGTRLTYYILRKEEKGQSIVRYEVNLLHPRNAEGTEVVPDIASQEVLDKKTIERLGFIVENDLHYAKAAKPVMMPKRKSASP